MYTQCPECQIAFRVTAKVLQQAGGNVRCGSCGHAFNALEYLSEEMPEQAFGDSGEESEAPVDELAETSRRLLETLNELAGPDDVRIEDTGVEWRVLDEAAAADVRLSPDELGATDEPRYDDNTPLPEDFDDDDDDDVGSFVVPQRREDDQAAKSEEFEDRQGDLALSEPEDWTDILEEVRDPNTVSIEVEEELAAIHNELSAIDEALTDEVPQLDEHGLGAADDEDADEIEAALIEQIEAGAVAELEFEADDADDADDESIDDDEDTGVFESVLAEDELDDITAADDEDEPADASLAAFAEEDGADVEPDFERESTGAFDAQIEDAARALAGDVDEDGAEEPRESAVVEDDDQDAEYDVTERTFPDDDDLEDQQDDAVGDDDVEEPVYDDDDEDVEELEDDAVGDDDVEERVYDDDDNDDDVAGIDDDFDEDEEELAADAESGDDTDSAAVDVDKEKFDFAATVVGFENAEELFDESSGEVETIIMEGDFIRSEVEKERDAAEQAARSEIDDPAKLMDTYALNRGKLRGGRRSYDPPSIAVVGAIVGLALILVGQYVHSSRQSLATYGFFNATIAPLYRLLGSPITPDWDINGWQFEATSGSIDDGNTTLTIVSRIANRSTQSLPYPLVHVELTDRFDDVTGSAILEPAAYLAADGDPSRPIEPGDNFTAMITVDDPDVEVLGYRLKVCYRIEPGSVRCAEEAFRN